MQKTIDYTPLFFSNSTFCPIVSYSLLDDSNLIEQTIISSTELSVTILTKDLLDVFNFGVMAQSLNGVQVLKSFTINFDPCVGQAVIVIQPLFKFQVDKNTQIIQLISDIDLKANFDTFVPI